MRIKLVFLTSAFVFGAVVFSLILNLIGTAEIFSSFKNFSLFPFVAFIAVSATMMVASVYRWKVIISAHGSKPGFWSLFSYRITGFSIGYITPGAFFGGEAFKALLLKKHNLSFEKGLSTVIIDKFFDIAIATAFTSAGIALALPFSKISVFSKAVLVSATFFWIVIIIFFIYSSLAGKNIFSRILRTINIRMIRNVASRVEKTEKYISRFFKFNKSEFRRASVISVVIWAMIFAEYKIATTVFAYDAGMLAVFVIMFISGLSYIIPVPGALGVMEAAQASVHSIIGFRAAQGLTLSLLLRARDIAWTVAGISFAYYFFSSGKKK